MIAWFRLACHTKNQKPRVSGIPTPKGDVIIDSSICIPVNYRCIQRYTGELVESVNPNINDLAELDAYFVLCEYYAYVSRKVSIC